MVPPVGAGLIGVVEHELVEAEVGIGTRPARRTDRPSRARSRSASTRGPSTARVGRPGRTTPRADQLGAGRRQDVLGPPWPASRTDRDPLLAVEGGQPEALGPTGGDGERQRVLHGARGARRLDRVVVRRVHGGARRRRCRRGSGGAPRGTPRSGPSARPGSRVPGRARWRRALRSRVRSRGPGVHRSDRRGRWRRGPGSRDGGSWASPPGCRAAGAS